MLSSDLELFVKRLQIEVSNLSPVFVPLLRFIRLHIGWSRSGAHFHRLLVPEHLTFSVLLSALHAVEPGFLYDAFSCLTAPGWARAPRHAFACRHSDVLLLRVVPLAQPLPLSIADIRFPSLWCSVHSRQVLSCRATCRYSWSIFTPNCTLHGVPAYYCKSYCKFSTLMDKLQLCSSLSLSNSLALFRSSFAPFTCLPRPCFLIIVSYLFGSC